MDAFALRLEMSVSEAVMMILAVPREGGSGTLIFFVNMALIFAIFYFLLIRPQRKEQEKQKKMIEQLKKGDQVVTAGGIIGTVIHAQEDRLTIKTAEDTRIEVERGKIGRVVDAAAR